MFKRLDISIERFHAIVLFGTFAVFLGLISRISIVDLDLFHGMALFREALQLGKLPNYDLYSYIPTVYPVIHHEWGTGAILYLLTVKLGLGAAGLIALKFLLTLFIVINCYRFALQRGGEKLTFAYTAFFGMVMGWIGFTTIRAQLFTLFLLLVLLFIIEGDRKKNPWVLWLLVPLFVVWINLHGGFVVGLGLVGLYIMERFLFHWWIDQDMIRAFRSVKKQLLVFFVSCMGLFINPYGSDYLPYLLQAITLDRTDLIPEWRPVWAISPFLLAIYCGALLLTLYPLWYKKWKEMAGLLMVLATAVAGLLHLRHISIFALLFLCYVPGYLQGTPVGDGISRLFIKNKNILALFYGTLGTLFMVYAFSNRFWELKVPTDSAANERGIPVYPAGAMDYLKKQGFKGNLMTPFRVGAYVSWKMYPDVKVSMDSRFEVAYPYEAVQENTAFYNGASSWHEISQRYGTDGLLVPNWAMVKIYLDEKPTTWKLIYKDGAYSLYMTEDTAAGYPVENLGSKTVDGTFP